MLTFTCFSFLLSFPFHSHLQILIQILERQGSMNVSPLSLIDRLPARSTLRGFTYSICGIVGSIAVILVALWMYVDLVIAYSKGMYFQSSFETQVSSYQSFQTPFDLKMAVVFYNKSSNAIANHTSLLTYFNPRIYAANGNLNPQYLQMTTTCDPNYFSDAINPITLSSCFTFTPNKNFTYSYQPGTSNPFSLVGIYFTYNCFNPFFCTTSGSAQISVQNSLIALFTNFSATFYFSTRVLQPSGATQHQVYYISTGEFNTPSTISATFSAEVVVSNVTMDYSIMPWTNILSISNLAWFGLKKGSTKSSTNVYSPLPRFDTIASNYQYLIFRYYKKEDWMLGIIGGGIFLIYFALWTVCHTFNRGLYRVNAAEQLLIEVKQTQLERSPTEEAFKRPSIPFLYHLLRFFPCYENLTINRVTEMLDIINILKQLKIAQRNLRERKALNHQKVYKRINFDIEVPRQQHKFLIKMEEEQPKPPKRSQKHVELDQSNSNLNPQMVHQDSLPFQNKPSDFQARMEEAPKMMQLEDENEEQKVEKPNNSNSPKEKERVNASLLQSHEKMINEDNEEENSFSFQQISFNPFKEGSPKQETEVEKKSMRSSEQKNKQEPQEKGEEIRQEKKSENKESQLRQHSSDDKSSGQKMEMKSLSRKDEIRLLDNQQSNSIVMRNQQEIQHERDENKINQRLSDLLGIHPQAIRALKNSENTKSLFANFLTVMHLTNNQEELNEIKENAEYDDDPYQPPKSKFQVFTKNAVSFFRLFDFYGVKVQFNADSANHSWVGVFFTLIIIALPCLQLFNLLQLAGTYQVIVSKDFLQPDQINYKLVTGQGQSFRPAACFSPTAYSQITGSAQTVQLVFYTYSASQGYLFYNPVNLATNQYSTLGITSDSLYSTIETSYCFIFPDGTPIAMGGYNTKHEAYFGFRIRVYCTGTSQYCNSTSATNNANLLYFLNLGQDSFTFYSPVNQYGPSQGSVLTGQVYAHALREGVNGFNTNTSIQETLYLDRIQLLDSYKAKLVGAPPQVVQESICTSRYQVGEVTKSVNTSSPYYQLRVRPSGNLTKVILTGYTLPMILGLIGGVFFICYVAFHFFGKFYNGYNMRMKLALDIYNEDAYNHSVMHKSCYLLSSLFCCKKCKYASTRMELLNKKMKYDLNALQIVKTIYSLSKLSAIPYNSVLEKEMTGIYFKEKANDLFKIKKEKVDKGDEASFIDDLEDWDEDNKQKSGINQVANESISEKSKEKKEEGEDNSSDGQESKQDELDKEYRLQALKKQVTFLQPKEPFRKDDNSQRSSWREFFQSFDWFHSDAEFNLNGKWRVRSIFGCLCTLLSIALILCIFLYYLILFDSKTNYLISYDRGILADPDNTPPLQLNYSNFRLAVGFYTKPDLSFVNVGQFINSTASSVIAVSVFMYKEMWISNALVNSQTKVDLIPCPANYFDQFMSPNDDPSYYASVTNGFCLPSNLTLNLTSNILNNTQYFKISVYNKTTTASTLLQSLTTSYPLGVYMSIPIINLQNQTFASEIQQIRPNSETITRTYEVNLTLTRQKIIFTAPNYTLNQLSTSSIETYNYLEDRAYERIHNVASTTLARVYNITFSHSGLRETYTLTYPSISELFGYAGGIIVMIIFVLGCIAQSFNTYYKEYLVGRSLYLYWSTKSRRRKNKIKLEEEQNENEQQHIALIEREDKLYFQRINDFSEWNVMCAWILSFPAALISSYDWNDTLFKVHLLQQQARIDLDLFTFYKSMVEVKDAINANPNNKLSANTDIPITSIYDKKLVLRTRKHQYPRSDRYFNDVKFHGLSSKDQWILTRAGEREIFLSDVFSREYLKNLLLSQDSPPREREEVRSRADEMRLQGHSNNQIDPQEWVDVPLQPQPQQQLPAPPALQNLQSEQNFQANIQAEQSQSSSQDN